MWIPGPGERVRVIDPNSRRYGQPGDSEGWRVEYNGAILIRVRFEGAYGFEYFPPHNLTAIR